MTFIKTPVKGTRDFNPEEMKLREYVLKVMKETYQKFGFEIIGTYENYMKLNDRYLDVYLMNLYL